MIVDTLDSELIKCLENIVSRIVKTNKFNIDVLLRSVLTVKNKAIAKQIIENLVCFMQSIGNIKQHQKNTIRLAHCDAILCIAAILIFLQILL